MRGTVALAEGQARWTDTLGQMADGEGRFGERVGQAGGGRTSVPRSKKPDRRADDPSSICRLTRRLEEFLPSDEVMRLLTDEEDGEDET